MPFATQKVGARVYITGDTYPVKDRIKAIGATFDKGFGERGTWWVGRAKSQAAEDLVAQLNNPSGPPAQEDPDNIRLTGKGEYKGKTYYIGSTTKDGRRYRLLTLPGADGKYLDFWADVALVKVTKTYQPRQVWDGRRYSNKTVTKYTTLGSIADYIKDQREAERQGMPPCAACGKRGDLIRDLEDGLMKCKSCCDIPSD